MIGAIKNFMMPHYLISLTQHLLDAVYTLFAMSIAVTPTLNLSRDKLLGMISEVETICFPKQNHTHCAPAYKT